MSDHPYRTLPDHRFWRRSIAGVSPSDVDPVVRTKFKISQSDRIVTAGSCFAQHIARHLATRGLTYFVTETAHPLVEHLAADYGYGLFTARYGNIYTSRQLLQTIQRAYGAFMPRDDAWPAIGGRVLDPYRPRVQPDGFACREELAVDRRQHFAAIRRAVEEGDVFVFTLGLTETWFHRSDGAVYPLCPGVAGGTFDETRHGFVNLGVTEVIADLCETIDLMRLKKATIRLILTVSPVPLVATMTDKSVLAATTYSKSVLRVAAEEVAARYEGVDYFPSYEIVTGAHARGRYFSEGLRDVTEEGVAHVMRLFMKHYAIDVLPAADVADVAADHRQRDHEQVRRELEELVAVMCDEVALDAQQDRTFSAPAPPRPDPPSTPAGALSRETAPPAEQPSAWDVLTGASLPHAQTQPTPPPASHPPGGLWSWLRRRR
jgi:hypothetical protein